MPALAYRVESPHRHPRGDWVLTLQCSVCGSPSAWHDEQDGREYCPAHLWVAQRKACIAQEGQW